MSILARRIEKYSKEVTLHVKIGDENGIRKNYTLYIIISKVVSW